MIENTEDYAWYVKKNGYMTAILNIVITVKSFSYPTL